MLTALAERLQAWLDSKTPEQRQRLQNEVVLRRQQRVGRQQDRMRQEIAAADTHAGVHGAHVVPYPAHATAAAAAAAGVVTAPVTAGHGNAVLVASSAAALPQPAGAEPGPRQIAAGMTDPAGATFGASSHSVAPSGSLGCRDDVRWWLQNYGIFHTEWHSSRRPPYTPSPSYNGQLLDEVVVELFGFRPRARDD